MAVTRKRRLFIAVVLVAVVGILFLSGKGNGPPDAFFEFLTQHPTANEVVRCVYRVAGKESEFNRRIFNVVVIETELSPN
jgi:hypothetical protein